MSRARGWLASSLSLALLAASIPTAAWAAERDVRAPETAARLAALPAAPGPIVIPEAAQLPAPAPSAATAEAPSAFAAALAAETARLAGTSAPEASPAPALGAARAAAATPETAAPSADVDAGRQVFDGAADAGLLGSVRGSLARLSETRLGRWLPRPSPSSTPSPDRGPAYTPLTLKQQAAYGLKWGVYLTGLAELVRLGVSTLAGALPWQATFAAVAAKIAALPVIGPWLPEFAAGAQSRIELLVDWGPARVAEALASHPVAFFLYELPKAVAFETLYYQVALFGGLAFVLRSLAPAAAAVTARLSRADDASLFGLKRALSALPAAMAALSRWAFPIAAFVSALAFGKDHLAAWGVNASAFLIPAVLGTALAYITYKTRSFVPALVAHFSYNALLIAGMALAAVSAQTAGLYSALVPLAAVAFLAYGYYRHARAGAAGWAWLKGPAKAAAGAAAVVGGGLLAATLLAGPMGEAPGLAQTQAQKPSIQLTLAKPGDKELTDEENVHLNKPAVAQLIVRTPRGTASGSGSIIDPSGLVVTNNHVIDAVGVGGHLLLRLNDGETVPGTVLAANKLVDLAFVQIEAEAPEGGWPVVAFGDSEQLKEGQRVVAMGYPFGFPFTVTGGMVSGVGQSSRRPYQIQHDAAVNPGNSGGPLFDKKGAQVGVNTAIYSPSHAFAGVSYGRSSAQVLAALQQYMETGTISPAWLGVVVDQSSPVPPSQGVLVDSVRPGSPAEKAGLRPGDLIVSMNGQTLPPGAAASAGALTMMIESQAPGAKVTLSVLRDEKTVAVPVVLGELLSHPGAEAHAKKGGMPMPHPSPDAEEGR